MEGGGLLPRAAGAARSVKRFMSHARFTREVIRFARKMFTFEVSHSAPT